MLAVAFCVPDTHARGGNASSCGGQRFAVGGVTGFRSLADSDATGQLREKYDVSLYIHAEAWRTLDDQTRSRILQNFSGTGPAVIELGYNPTGDSFFRHFYKPVFIDKGVHAEVALINGLCQDGLDNAKTYVDAARTYGLQKVAIVFTPNSGQYASYPFEDPRWTCAREIAKYGGAIAIDAPPHFYLNQPAGYRTFVEQEIRWAKDNGVKQYYILSPNASGEKFFDEAKQTIATLAGSGLPSNFVFETYDIHRGDMANQVGSETEPDTVAGVAKRLIPLIARMPCPSK